MKKSEKLLVALVVLLVTCHLLFVRPAWIKENCDPAPSPVPWITPHGWADHHQDTIKKDSSKYLEY